MQVPKKESKKKQKKGTQIQPKSLNQKTEEAAKAKANKNIKGVKLKSKTQANLEAGKGADLRQEIRRLMRR